MDINKPTNLEQEPGKEVIEIRLSDIWIFLSQSRRLMLVGLVMGSLLGIAYAFLQSDQYSSQVTVMPEVQTKGSSNLGNLSSLAGLAGLNLEGLANASDAIRPDLYPTVTQSIPFAIYLLNQPVVSREFGNTQPLDLYLKKHGEKTFRGWLKNVLPAGKASTEKQLTITNKEHDVVQLTKPEEEAISDLLQHISVVPDKKTGITTIAATMPDPLVAATVAQKTLDYLTDYITSYRTEKARKEVIFLTNQVTIARKRYQSAEVNLAAYRDRNRGQYLNTAKIEEQRLQAEFLLAQDLYNSLSKQLELSKIKVQEQTPVFKVLNPAQVPLRKSKPKRTIIIGVTAILGLMGGLGFALLKRMARKTT